MSLENAILTVVNGMIGAHRIAIAINCIDLCKDEITDESINKTLEKLVSERKIVKLGYSLTGSKIRSIYFPANTSFYLYQQNTSNETNKHD